jgi:hypothetical protein
VIFDDIDGLADFGFDCRGTIKDSFTVAGNNPASTYGPGPGGLIKVSIGQELVWIG